MTKEKLVILGSGWGGYQVLRNIDKKRWDVTVVSPNGHFAFTPLLAGCAVGTLEFRCTIEPVRRYARQITSYQAWCDAVDFKQKTLLCTPATRPPTLLDTSEPEESGASGGSEPNKSFELKYDKLVVAVGAYSQTFGVPGVKENAYFLKGVNDARLIRQRIIECFDQASQPTLTDEERRQLLHFCIVGGGPTGVEFAAELHDLLQDDAGRHYPELTKLAQITLYDVAAHILPSFDKGLVDYAEKRFTRSGIMIKLQHHVERVEQGYMMVKEQGRVPFGLLVWSTGLAPNPLVQSLDGFKKDERTGGILTDANLNILREDDAPSPDVWAIGDAAIIEDQPLPATAQVASQKGRFLASHLNNLAKGKESTKPFEFHNMGSLAYIGDWKAVYDRGKAGGGGWRAKEGGRLAWILWRSAYMTMTLSWRNKFVVPFYWVLNAIFGRDMSRF